MQIAKVIIKAKIIIIFYIIICMKICNIKSLIARACSGRIKITNKLIVKLILLMSTSKIAKNLLPKILSQPWFKP